MKATIIAVGNGGYNLASDIRDAHLFQDTKLIVCGTDKEQLIANAKQADVFFCLNKILEAKSNLVRAADSILFDATDKILVCATLGGQTGSVYAPLIALASILKGKFVCSAFSMPFDFERKRIKTARTARMQLITASNFVVQQNNEMLKEVGDLNLAKMNKPIIEAIKAATNGHSLPELASASDNEIQEIIPESYRRQKEKPLIRLHCDCFRGISDKGRKEVFDSFL